MRPPVRLALAALAATLLAGCGTEEEGYIEDTYQEVASVGDVDTYRSPATVPDTTAAIAAHTNPAARASADGTDYLRYDQNIVLVRQEAGGAATEVRVEDLDGAFRAGAYSHLGPGFQPGDAPDDGGPGDSK